MKYLVMIHHIVDISPLLSGDKIVYFDTKKEADSFIDGCRIALDINFDDLYTKPIDASEINDEAYINYKNVHYM